MAVKQKTEILTDHSMRELADHGTDRFPFQYYLEDMRQFHDHRLASHWHKEFEFVTVSSGTVLFQVGNNRYPVQAGDGIFINTGVIHGMETAGEGIIPNILFTGSLIAAENTGIYNKYVGCFFHSDISHLILHRTIPWQKEILEQLDLIYKLSASAPTDWELDIHVHLCLLWKLLFAHRDELSTTEQTGISLRSRTRLSLMTQFIEQHYSEKITLADIAASASISKSEALRCFQSNLQMSPLTSVREYRLARARELLLTTDETVTEIASRTGFDSCSYFDRMFKKKYGGTPRMLRGDFS